MQSSTWFSTRSLSAHTFAHFCVDFACFYQLFAGLAKANVRLETVAIGFMLYNAIAFGLQPIIGYACDRKRSFPIAVVGCLLVLGGLVLLPLAWLALLLSALGNACFHVGGGSESLVNANGKMARSGIFVSSGALGVALGTLLGKGAVLAEQGTAQMLNWSYAVSILVPIALLLLSIVSLAHVNLRPTMVLPTPTKQPENALWAENPAPFRTASTRHSFAAVMLLCLVSITIRSYVGSIIPIDWRTSTVLMLLPALGAMSGKAAGGFLADWLGARRIGVFSLLAAMPFLVFGNANPISCMLGIILFNISMSITLCAVYDLLPGYPGLSFGLTTLALLVGSLPAGFLALSKTVTLSVMGILIVASAGCLHLAAANQPRQERTQPNGGTKDEAALSHQIPDAV